MRKEEEPQTEPWGGSTFKGKVKEYGLIRKPEKEQPEASHGITDVRRKRTSQEGEWSSGHALLRGQIG